MESVNDLLNSEFDFAFRATIYNNMKIALTSYNELVSEKRSLFSFEKSKTAKGHLKTLFIEKQFNDCAFKPTSHYSVRLKEVNKYHHKALFMETEHFELNIARTQKACMLPNKSMYRLEYAKNNKPLDIQYELNLDNKRTVDYVVLPRKYAILTYGINHDELSHLEMVVPQYDYSGFIGYVDLKKDHLLLERYIPDEIVEESIVSLKNNLVEEYNIV